MADVFPKQKRSQIMSANRGKANRSTELRLRVRLSAHGISGWKLNSADVLGKPDFTFDRERVVVFVDGCFWHGCRHCRNIPATNREFWSKKIEGNRQRDRSVTRNLRRAGWHVVRIWEHEMRRAPEDCIRRIERALAASDSRPSHRCKGALPSIA